jgi:hypothetical protein
VSQKFGYHLTGFLSSRSLTRPAMKPLARPGVLCKGSVGIGFVSGYWEDSGTWGC